MIRCVQSLQVSVNDCFLVNSLLITMISMSGIDRKVKSRTKLCKLAQSLKSIRERKELLPIQDVLQSVRPSLNDRMTGIRAAAIRVVRYVMVDVETIKLLRQLRIDIFIVQ
jgi:hypothetical protein